jgi:hypothetical protein
MMVRSLSIVSLRVWTVNPQVSRLDVTGSWNVGGWDWTPVSQTLKPFSEMLDKSIELWVRLQRGFEAVEYST